MIDVRNLTNGIRPNERDVPKLARDVAQALEYLNQNDQNFEAAIKTINTTIAPSPPSTDGIISYA